jgi:dihydroorotate dehydrogenase
MANPIQKSRNTVIGVGYKYLAKPVFFAQDPEKVHDGMIKVARFSGKHKITKQLASLAFNYHHPSLEQNILGINFKNPVGLSAGFDKDALITDILPKVGFGFAEIGSVTAEPSPGNSGTRLWRLKSSKAIGVYYGLKNDGAKVIASRLIAKTSNMPIGVSVAKTNCQATAEDNAGIADYVKAYKIVQNVGDYYTINISCPNTYGGQPFNDARRLNKLLIALDKVKTKKPVFVKLSPDLSKQTVNELIDVCKNHNVQGFVCSNLTKDRTLKQISKEDYVPELGGFSGKIVENKANQLIEHVYKQTKGKYIIIGVGGIFSAQDAYTKIKLGANLVQLITGMIYQGPQTISDINIGLVQLLKQDGYSNISQAVGVYHSS